ncbi:UvrD-helicase domain-containing protein [Streptomyces sp. NPDC023998]|uniref:UvrD-helicase domain-containing protein n=1 Tax=Streptomyces sp. NPDC023998 TaxID=3154597 RepID=UPI0033F70D28
MTTAQAGAEHPAAPPLTIEQQAVVDLPCDAKALVTAGAGAGKTHTLVRRLDMLVERDDLVPGEILVLSFSRAAVRELRSRIVQHAAAAERVRVQTFDGWATGILSELDPDGGWNSTPFDNRIESATDAINEGYLDDVYGEQLGHVVIDEVQDLVGPRREMVESLLERFRGAGFTVVGDPAQSIYGFQIRDLDQRALEVNAFFTWLRHTFPDRELTEIHLTHNFRARKKAAELALSMGTSLQRNLTAAEYTEIHDTLRSRLLTSTDPFGSLNDSFALNSLKMYEGSCAILCRHNGHALKISEQLHAGGIPHRLQRSAQERVVPAWLGMLYSLVEGSSLMKGRFDDLLPALGLSPASDPEVFWSALLRADGRSADRRSIDLHRVKTALATGRIPDELMAQPPASIAVSTVHRAKGLEFDRVIVAVPDALGSRARDHIDAAGDARALYVAMTRPREQLYHLDMGHDWCLEKDSKRHGSSDRWIRRGRQQRSGQRYGMEVLGGDAERGHPAGASHQDTDPLDLQNYLAQQVRADDPVSLELLHDLPTGEDQSPPYAIVHSGRRIGTVSERFRRDLYGIRGVRRSAYDLDKWPRSITGLRIDTVETVAGSDAAAAAAGLGGRGVWLVPRPMGMGHFDWSGEAAGEGEQ